MDSTTKYRPTIGDRVTYDCISLRASGGGRIEKVEKGARGGDCAVRWDRFPEFLSEQCAFNLRLE